MCGFQDKFSVKFIPKILKLGTNSMVFFIDFQCWFSYFLLRTVEYHSFCFINIQRQFICF